MRLFTVTEDWIRDHADHTDLLRENAATPGAYNLIARAFNVVETCRHGLHPLAGTDDSR